MAPHQPSCENDSLFSHIGRRNEGHKIYTFVVTINSSQETYMEKNISIRDVNQMHT